MLLSHVPIDPNFNIIINSPVTLAVIIVMDTVCLYSTLLIVFIKKWLGVILLSAYIYKKFPNIGLSLCDI